MDSRAALPAELRPRDFTARFGRRARGIAARRRPRHYGRRAAVLLAAIAVPAFAAPSDWKAFAIGDAGRAEVAVEPMPFERPGDSFPGSAFYYLAPEDPASLSPGVHSDGEDTPLAESPVARAMRVDNSGIDRSRALQCLTAAIYYEAASEPDGGQRAVAQVVLNRVAHPSYPNTVCGVVFQGSERRTGCQFSFTCDGSMARRPNRLFWERAEAVARTALSGYVYAPVGLATHYHTIAVNPYWAAGLHYLQTIGAHRFYSFKGPAGQPSAFRFAYLGGEPLAAPHAHDPAAGRTPDPALDPLAIEQAWVAQGQAATAAKADFSARSRPAPAPTYAPEVERRGGDALYRGDNLPDANGVRPEYRNSGQWIARPTT
jgi:spore germination cell wall hydrolase CwlJ-like protein